MDNGISFSSTPYTFGTGDILYNHRLLLEASEMEFLVSTTQLAELTQMKYGSANQKPDVWGKWGFLFNRIRLEEGGSVWRVKRVVLTDR